MVKLRRPTDGCVCGSIFSALLFVVGKQGDCPSVVRRSTILIGNFCFIRGRSFYVRCCTSYRITYYYDLFFRIMIHLVYLLCWFACCFRLLDLDVAVVFCILQ